MIMVRILVVSMVVVAITIFATTVTHALVYAPDYEVPIADTPVMHVPVRQDVHHEPEALPVRVAIPSLGIDAKIQKVGIKADGTMATPNNFSDVGWYKYGTVPGDTGSAVMAGHVDNGLGLAGVFKHLSDIREGEYVYVTRDDGSTLTFVVVATASYPYNEAPEQEIFAQKGGEYLNLITCHGSWVKDARTYDERLVVYTKLIEGEK